MQFLQTRFRGNSWRPFTRLLPILVGAIIAGGTFLGAQPALAIDDGQTTTGQICMQKVFGTPVTNANKLNCTANDIRISRAISASPESCIEGETFDLTATFEINVTANARYDAGFFFRIDGGANARGDGSSASGVCSLSDLTVPAPTGSGSPALKLDTDTCGDLNAGTFQVTFTIPDVTCTGVTDPQDPTKKILKLPNCTSWHSNQGTTCNVTGTLDNTEAFDFDPDTKSKCVCDDNFTVPVIVETASVTVVKDASPTTVSETGGTVTYTVTATNSASVVSLTVNSISDDIYGDLSDPNNPEVTDNTCADLVDPPSHLHVGKVLAPGASATCTFKALVSGDSGDTVTDTAEVCGTDSSGHTGLCGHDDADVNITDAFTAPTLAKTAQSAANCQLDVTYQVVVNNNSSLDTLTVNSLTDDKFGNIISAHAAGGGFEQVVSTTCSLPQQPIAASGNFTCTFVGRITSTSCDITHTDTVTGSVTDDDGVTTDGTSTPPLKDDATVTMDTTP